MEAISRLPRRLTQLYTDTKVSCEAVTEQDTPDTQPEINALHRKYRIQKDRLIAWGLEWSDNTKGRQDDIDESVERAGLTETVTSVLGTIKDILDEAERMHPPAVIAGVKTLSGEKSRPPVTSAWAAADRSRYEDLAKDLTTSIDILYDLSRTRRTQREASRGPSPHSKAVPPPPRRASASGVFSTSQYSASDLTLINPDTIPIIAHEYANISAQTNLPSKLNPADLVLPEEEPPPYESVGASSIRVIGRLRTKHTSTNPWKADGAKSVETPVMVEFATYDPTYRSTGVPTPTDRLETLLSILGKLSTDQSFHGTLTCLGYFEDPSQPRFGLVFELPSFVYSGASDLLKPVEELRPVTLLSVLQTGSKSLHNSNSATPPLEDRFRLAFTLGLTFNKIHGDGFVHKDVNSSNILVFRKNKRQSANSRALQFALRSPIICSFDLFSEYDIEPASTMPPLNIYRHPEDPKFTGEKDKTYGPQFDLYSLGLILLEVGLWQPLADLWKPKYTLTDFKQRVEDVYIRRLASKCGTAYMQVVRDCFWAADRIASGAESPQNFPQVYNRILIRLQRCCLLDEVDPSLEWGELSTGATHIAGSSPLKRKTSSHIQGHIQVADVPSSPSYRSAKRWALEKGSHVLERSRSLSKTTHTPKSSPNLPPLSRHGSQRSQHSIRKSLSHLMSPKEEPSQEMDWQLSRNSHMDTPPDSQEHGDLLPVNEHHRAHSTGEIKRSRGFQSEFDTPPRAMTQKDYKDKITLIQNLWRQRKQNRANTIGALIENGIRHWPQATIGYPTPEPEDKPQDRGMTHSVHIQRHPDQSTSPRDSTLEINTNFEAPPRQKLRLHPVKFSEEIVDEWHKKMLPRLERVLERTLKDSDETVSIDLVAVGETADKTRPTIFVTCSSVPKVKAVLQRRFKYDPSIYDLKVRRGKVRRSKLNRSSRRRVPPHRSMANTDDYDGDMHVMNPFHQERPVCGASIGAFRGEHLPPVTYGGVVLVDDEPLGMSVHHLLDAPSDDESDAGDDPVLSSGANGSANPWLMGMGTQPGVQIAPSSPMPMWELEISDDEAMKTDDEDYDSFELSGSEFDSDEESESEDADVDSITSRGTIGDIDGIEVGDGEEIKITQPAIDDVDDDFFPSEEDRDEDHLDSHELGHVHASSGIRRLKKDGIVHEIDWALLKLNDHRLQPYNLVQGGRRFCATSAIDPSQYEISAKLEQPVTRRHYTASEDEYPNGVASATSLGGLSVHCFGRTTGLQGGMVGHAMSSVRIYRRKTFSRSWHVAGGFGVGGDSGAWVVQNGTHKVVGHVLAWCERNHIAYICPMEVLLEDIKRTLHAKHIYLPGSAEEARHLARTQKHALKADSRVEELEVAVEGLGIIDGCVPPPPPPPRRSRIPLLGTSGESDKENLPVLRSRVIKVKEGMSGQLEMVAGGV
ncbi:uncharacterized protein N0V89_004772 [Didymosphaeria variabile]|uniref:Protein kinase domain-containing protein n=1 Tax=Didymosphaeria variabile TaxID=1932322 RepID=A0A9W8XSG2_9PLEO|nr:uncharacterized protein N0V89_004772 [Didymosphaeria variabile]KAJ4356736.1 hypothetical protein N0V89_004772 [Didymosphaeria variabile]